MARLIRCSTGTARWTPEVFGALVGANLAVLRNPGDAIKRAFAAIKGANTIALFRPDEDIVFIGTSNGSMYFSARRGSRGVSSSHRNGELSNARRRGCAQPEKFLAWSTWRPDAALPSTLSTPAMRASRSTRCTADPRVPARCLHVSWSSSACPKSSRTPLLTFANRLHDIERLMTSGPKPSPRFRRCTKCVLPETFPFIAFDAGGVCQFCRTHTPPAAKGRRRAGKDG